MNSYPIDAVAVNGTDILFSGGDMSMQIAASGTSGVAVLGAGTSAMNLAAQGSTISAVRAAGDAPIALDVSGEWKLATIASAVTEMFLEAAGQSADVQLGVGQASMTLAASYGLPDPIVIPGTYMPAHKTCEMIVQGEDTTMRVPADPVPRVVPMIVPSENTTMRVPADPVPRHVAPIERPLRAPKRGQP